MHGKIILLIGLHGVGKTTIAKEIENNFGFRHLSIGDIGRSIRRRKIPAGLSGRFVRLMAAHEPGKSLDSELAESIKEWIVETSKEANIIVDGFPAEKDHVNLIPPGSYLIKIKCDEEERVARLKNRSETTKRKWSEGIQSIRDQKVDDVMFAAFARREIKAFEISNHGPVDIIAKEISILTKII